MTISLVTQGKREHFMKLRLPFVGSSKVYGGIRDYILWKCRKTCCKIDKSNYNFRRNSSNSSNDPSLNRGKTDPGIPLTLISDLYSHFEVYEKISKFCICIYKFKVMQIDVSDGQFSSG